jgi:UDP-N-acetylglucosamine--dolichyl-phosphate N-acetylglucosaminephosphotransferase
VIDFLWFSISAILIILGYLVVTSITMPLAEFMRSRGITGIDVHKPEQPAIPDMGGSAIVVALIVCLMLLGFLNYENLWSYVALVLVIIVAAIVGIIDAFRPWNALLKVAVIALASIPLILFGAYQSFPELPFIGPLRMTILYPLVFVPLFVTLVSNATNMFDVFNGSMAGTTSIAAVFLSIASLILGRIEVAVIYLLMAACLFGFYRYNRYPARVFSADVGSLGVGAAFAAVAIIGRMEFLTIIALMPAMINGSIILSSVGRLFERREISERPTMLLEDGRIAATKGSAPITLTRLLVAFSPLREDAIVKNFCVLNVFSGILTVATALFMVI